MPKEVKAVMDRRRKYALIGEARAQGMLQREGVHLNVSIVCRILDRALAVGLICHASFREGRLRPKRRRTFA